MVLREHRAHFTQDGRQPDPAGILPDPVPTQRIIPKGNLKLTWQATSRNKLSAIMNYELPFEHNRVAGLGMAPEAQEDRKTQRIFGGLIWESVLRDDLIFRSQPGPTTSPSTSSRPRAERPETCNDIPAVQQTFPRDPALAPTATHRRPICSACSSSTCWTIRASEVLGEHNLQIKNAYSPRRTSAKRPARGTSGPNRTGPSRSPDHLLLERPAWKTRASAGPSARTTPPRTSSPWRTPGGRPGTSRSAPRSRTSGPRAATHRRRGDQRQTWAPGLSAVWDATHDGLTAVRGSFELRGPGRRVSPATRSAG